MLTSAPSTRFLGFGLACICFLVLHTFLNPYLNRLHNVVETISLSCLAAQCLLFAAFPAAFAWDARVKAGVVLLTHVPAALLVLVLLRIELQPLADQRRRSTRARNSKLELAAVANDTVAPDNQL